MFKNLSIHFLSFVFAFSAFAADETSVQKLLKQARRPSIEQVENLISNAVAVDIDDEQQESLDKLARKMGPDVLSEMLVLFEANFPGATWAFIGRDSEYFADFFEAFYRKKGMNNRVVRVRVSSDSLKLNDGDGPVSQKTILGFLRDTCDFDPRDLTEKSKPFVFIDTLSRHDGRQGRLFLAAVYAELLKLQKLQPAEIVKKVNFIGLQTQTHRASMKTITLDYQTSFPHMVSALSKTKGEYLDLFDQVRFLYLGAAKNNFHEIGYSHNIGSWHDSWSTISFDPAAGSYDTKPGAELPQRRSVLFHQLSSTRLAQSQEFEEKIKDSAARQKLDAGVLFASTEEELKAVEEKKRLEEEKRRNALAAKEKILSEIKDLLEPGERNLEERAPNVFPLDEKLLANVYFLKGANQAAIQAFLPAKKGVKELSANAQELLRQTEEIKKNYGESVAGHALMILIKDARVDKRISAYDIGELVTVAYKNAEISRSLVNLTRILIKSTTIFEDMWDTKFLEKNEATVTRARAVRHAIEIIDECSNG